MYKLLPKYQAKVAFMTVDDQTAYCWRFYCVLLSLLLLLPLLLLQSRGLLHYS